MILSTAELFIIFALLFLNQIRYMSSFLLRVRKVFGQLLLLLLIYTLFRLCFYLFNRPAFSGITAAELRHIFLWGWRFDVSAILIINSLYILLSLLPIDTLSWRKWQKGLRMFFILTNSIAFLFEIADWRYFMFNHKRSTADVLSMVSRKGDFIAILPSFLKDYWYLFLMAAVLIVVFYKISKTFDDYIDRCYAKHQPYKKGNFLTVVWQILGLAVVAGLSVIGIRCGLQLIPFNIRNAVEITKSQYSSIVLNTPYSIINTIQNTTLAPETFMPEEEAYALIQPVKRFSGPFQPKNVVFIIVESLSKEWTKLGNGADCTPFLDSLMDHSLTFTNAYANGRHSNDGVPAILSGIPALMDEPFIESIYSNNKIVSIASLLEQKGYSTAFYHGATNGSMNLYTYSQTAGFDHYFGRTEYNNEKDYDGAWGIYDEPFLQYFYKGLNTMPQPFLASVFTLSSHPPYSLPKAYKDIFNKGDLPIENSIAYADYAIRRFFDSARQQPWYANTLFVITADHCSPAASNDFYANGAGRYQVPILFFEPGNDSCTGYNNVLTQQIDLLPGIMQYLGYDRPFYALGNSMFDTAVAHRFVINRADFVYEWIQEGYRMKLKNDAAIEAYTFPADSLAAHNLIPEGFNDSPQGRNALLRWKAFVQIYTHAMINNKMTLN